MQKPKVGKIIFNDKTKMETFYYLISRVLLNLQWSRQYGTDQWNRIEYRIDIYYWLILQNPKVSMGRHFHKFCYRIGYLHAKIVKLTFI